MAQQKIIILDFGSQTTQLIGRRLRELDTLGYTTSMVAGKVCSG